MGCQSSKQPEDERPAKAGSVMEKKRRVHDELALSVGSLAVEDCCWGSVDGDSVVTGRSKNESHEFQAMWAKLGAAEREGLLEVAKGELRKGSSAAHPEPPSNWTRAGGSDSGSGSAQQAPITRPLLEEGKRSFSRSPSSFKPPLPPTGPQTGSHDVDYLSVVVSTLDMGLDKDASVGRSSYGYDLHTEAEEDLHDESVIDRTYRPEPGKHPAAGPQNQSGSSKSSCSSASGRHEAPPVHQTPDASRQASAKSPADDELVHLEDGQSEPDVAGSDADDTGRTCTPTGESAEDETRDKESDEGQQPEGLSGEANAGWLREVAGGDYEENAGRQHASDDEAAGACDEAVEFACLQLLRKVDSFTAEAEHARREPQNLPEADADSFEENAGQQPVAGGGSCDSDLRPASADQQSEDSEGNGYGGNAGQRHHSEDEGSADGDSAGLGQQHLEDGDFGDNAGLRQRQHSEDGDFEDSADLRQQHSEDSDSGDNAGLRQRQHSEEGDFGDNAGLRQRQHSEDGDSRDNAGQDGDSVGGYDANEVQHQAGGGREVETRVSALPAPQNGGANPDDVANAADETNGSSVARDVDDVTEYEAGMSPLVGWKAFSSATEDHDGNAGCESRPSQSSEVESDEVEVVLLGGRQASSPATAGWDQNAPAAGEKAAEDEAGSGWNERADQSRAASSQQLSPPAAPANQRSKAVTKSRRSQPPPGSSLAGSRRPAPGFSAATLSSSQRSACSGWSGHEAQPEPAAGTQPGAPPGNQRAGSSTLVPPSSPGLPPSPSSGQLAGRPAVPARCSSGARVPGGNVPLLSSSVPSGWALAALDDASAGAGVCGGRRPAVGSSAASSSGSRPAKAPPRPPGLIRSKALAASVPSGLSLSRFDSGIATSRSLRSNGSSDARSLHKAARPTASVGGASRPKAGSSSGLAPLDASGSSSVRSLRLNNPSSRVGVKQPPAEPTPSTGVAGPGEPAARSLRSDGLSGVRRTVANRLSGPAAAPGAGGGAAAPSADAGRPPAAAEETASSAAELSRRDASTPSLSTVSRNGSFAASTSSAPVKKRKVVIRKVVKKIPKAKAAGGTKPAVPE